MTAIPGSINIPLPELDLKIEKKVKSKETPLYLYCLSGSRSGVACSILRSKGYNAVHNIGAIYSYKGNLEK